MKRAAIIMLIVLSVFLLGCGENRQNKTDRPSTPECVGSVNSARDYHLTVLANRDVIEDKEAFARELIEQVRKDGFHKIKFCYEDTGGYPIGLEIRVYLWEEDWQDRNKDPYMIITFRQENMLDGYNIVEHNDKFQMNIK